MRIYLYVFSMVIVFCSTVFADTYEAKHNTAQWLPVVMVDGTDGMTPEIGILYTGVTLWYKEGINGTWTQYALTVTSCTATDGYWCEESSTNAPGSYRVYVPATVTDTKGKLFYIVKGAGYKTYWGQVSVTANTSAEDPVAAILDDTGTSGVLVSPGTGTGQISLSSGAVTVGSINTGVITATAIADGAITQAKEYIIADTVNLTSTTLKVYTALAITGERKYNNMCLYSASNGERSRIMSTGSGYFNVRGFGAAPTNGTVLRIYSDGCL